MTMSLPGLVLNRVLLGIPTLLIIVTATFVLIRLAPGDPALILAGDAPTPEFLAAINERYGLDRPILEQLLIFLGQAIRFDLGTSIYYQQPVVDVVLQRAPATIILTASAILVAALAGVIFGVWAARHKGTNIDAGVGLASLLGYSLPAFWLGQLLILLFAVQLNILPAGGMTTARIQLSGAAYYLDVARHMVLPVLTLATFELGLIARFTRTAMVEALGRDYVLVARAKGGRMNYVVWKHAFPNAIVTTITIVGLEFGVLLGGAVVTETVFSWPGIGRLFYDAILRRDFPLLTGCFILSSIAVIVINLITDLLCAILDPRTRR
ncbi:MULTISPECIES: ABC transporter permease [unclassified Chelatococcus]|uniref:ABC transporter permease n=1 Tax=unclassified Chelatococcus TaxID=2638111 RepID=UPI001BCC2643|nr:MULTISPECIES: ABC transporter permease [unclassified Chelatococcus]MBS7700477.1 ABC transporter permease [Chelatococcus sp. YT9]MBX3556273.1 ABC transporter permease [Chelatococcus sp.]